MRRSALTRCCAAALAALALAACSSRPPKVGPTPGLISAPGSVHATTTSSPLKHLIIIFQENVSFDRYFGTYPGADGFPGGDPKRVVPQADGALPYHAAPAEALAHDVPHEYNPMYTAYNGGKMDLYTKVGGRYTMGYFDYHDVPGYWLLAKRYALADHWFQPVFGGSTPGALQLIAGYSGNLKRNADPPFDPHAHCFGLCASPFTVPNIGDALSKAGVSWGWYQEGWSSGNGYVPHHNPFTYFTASDPKGANAYKEHLLDLTAFQTALQAGSLPAVTYVKGGTGGGQTSTGKPTGDNGHAGQSGPNQDDQFVATMVNAIMQSPIWNDCAVVITYDESGGFYDHVPPPQEQTPDGVAGNGPRVPALFVSPYTRPGFVSHKVYNHASLLRFIEWNWRLPPLGNPGRRDETAGDFAEVFDFSRPPAVGQPLPPSLAERVALWSR